MVDGGGAVAGVHPCLGHAGWVAIRDSRVTLAAVSETLAAVARTVSSRPRVSQPRWRLRPMMRSPASAPWPARWTVAEVLGAWESSKQAEGSLLRPSASRTRCRSRPVSWAKMPACCHLAKDRLVRRKVVGQVAPGDADAIDAEDGVPEAAQVVFGRAAGVQSVSAVPGPPGGSTGSISAQRSSDRSLGYPSRGGMPLMYRAAVGLARGKGRGISRHGVRREMPERNNPLLPHPRPVGSLAPATSEYGTRTSPPTQH